MWITFVTAACRLQSETKMALLRYFEKKKKEPVPRHNTTSMPLPSKVKSLSNKELEQVNEIVAAKTMELIIINE